MDEKRASKLGLFAGMTFAIGIIHILRTCGVEMFSRATTFSDILPHDYHGALGMTIQLLMFYIGVELFSRAYKAGCSMGYRVDGVILASCVLYSVYYGDFFHAISPLGIYVGVLVDVFVTRANAARPTNA